LKEFWPNRNRDDDFVKLFAEEFQGYWLWVKRDKEWLESSKAMSSRSWELADFHVGDDGSMYRHTDGLPVCVDLPQDTEKAVMEFLRQALCAWFNAFQELEADLKLDLSLLTPPATREAAPEPEQLSSSLAPIRWQREPDGWWKEELPHSATKVTVTCGGGRNSRFVKFFEGGQITYQSDDATLAGIFIKVAGHEKSHHFDLPLTSESQQALQSWIASVDAGSPILLALLGDDVEPALDILKILGAPSKLPLGTSALAAAGLRRTGKESSWYSTHASADIAYVSIAVASGKHVA